MVDAEPDRATQLAVHEEKGRWIENLGEFIARSRANQVARIVRKTSLLRDAKRIFIRRGISAIWVTANQDENRIAGE